MNGDLEKCWEVHCNRCEMPVLGLALNGTKADAAKEVRDHYGWETRDGKWYCHTCKQVVN